MASTSENRSTLKEFLASIATISGDLSNITAPPFVLATQSTVEFPAYWAEHQQLFLAPAVEQDPALRALAVLRWYLTSLKNQQYGGRDEKDGVKKPLNAFLGELFLASWPSEDESHDSKTTDNPQHNQTQLVAEQVSHHPPVTACCLWNEAAGIRAEGYTRQEISFNGSVSIKQIGHATLHIDRFNEDYLVPLPDVKVKGILTGTPYPELCGSTTYRIVSSTGYVAEIDFSGKGLFSGRKNSVDATLYRCVTNGQGEKVEKTPLFTVSGQWSHELCFRDAQNDKEIETIDVTKLESTPMHVEALKSQDPWESRRAWSEVISALRAGDMQRTVDAKSKIEESQRALRKHEEADGTSWTPLFFHNDNYTSPSAHQHNLGGASVGAAVDQRTDADLDPLFMRLASAFGGADSSNQEDLYAEKTIGVWRFDREGWAGGVKRPFRGFET